MTVQTPPIVSALKISAEQLAHLCIVVRDRFGIVLGPEKRSLIETRMRPMVGKYDCASYTEFHNRHMLKPTGDVLEDLADALSTNHTFFWRENKHFTHAKDVALPWAMSHHAKDRDLRVWCAAASTGEEPYTLAILLKEAIQFENGSWQAGVFATDISTDALATARAATYRSGDVGRLPQPWPLKWFERADTGRVQVKQEIRKMVLYRTLNLIRDPFPSARPFDMIFCRNVLIYFDEDTRHRILSEMCRRLTRGGFLYIGHSEVPPQRLTGMRLVAPAVYRRF